MKTQLKPDANVNDLFRLTFRRIRRTIGYLGISLPIILVLLSLFPFFKTEIQPSISDYYYTNFREIFTGTLCAVGLFMIRYKGYGNAQFFKNDNALTNIAGFMAFGVALFPTFPIGDHVKLMSFIPYNWQWIGYLHYGCAAVLFLSFAILAINVFTLGQEKNSKIPVSVFNENHIYKFCGWGIVFCVVLIPIAAKLDWFYHSTLVFEALSLVLFGVAWLIKGRALGDSGLVGEKVYREKNTTDTEVELQEKVEEKTGIDSSSNPL